MKKDMQKCYLVPKIEVYYVETEQGFAISNMEMINPERPELDW